MSRGQPRLTTTSYAILGLLCLDEWSAYELARQMERSLRFIWPRAQSAIYLEPAKLVDAGYASMRVVAAGPSRTKSAYQATPAGRRAFRAWLGQPSAPPQFESEAFVRFMFADQGSLEDLRRVLDDLTAHVDTLQEQLAAIATSYAEKRTPYPDRAHINASAGRFLHQYAEALAQWTTWARKEIGHWPDTGPAAAPRARQIAREVVRRYVSRTVASRRPDAQTSLRGRTREDR